MLRRPAPGRRRCRRPSARSRRGQRQKTPDGNRAPFAPLTPASLPDHLLRPRIQQPGRRFARRRRLRRSAATSRQRLGRIATLTGGSAVSRRSSGRLAGAPSRLRGCLGRLLRTPRAVVAPPPSHPYPRPPPATPPTHPRGLPPLTFPANAPQGRARSREDVKDGTPAGGAVLWGGGVPRGDPGPGCRLVPASARGSFDALWPFGPPLAQDDR